jgi:outer membrane protein OmpA-like peptidoglycan-associated protein
MKKGCILLFVLLLGVSGCGGRRKRKGEPVKEKRPVATAQASTNVAIPLAQDQSRSFFDDDLEEFELVDNQTDNAAVAKVETPAPETPATTDEVVKQDELEDEFAWVEADEKREQNELNVVYFDFDRYVIKQNEEEKVVANAESLKKMLDEQEVKGTKATIVIEGHACHSAGSAIYNLALSEKRAKVLADRLVESGISRSQIKIVGRGKEFPAIIDGKPVTGSRDEQWRNRRDELTVINA